MTEAHDPGVTVQFRNWRDSVTGNREPVIVIRHGPVFVRVPIAEAYEVVNKVHDIAEEHERRAAERTVP